MKCVKISLFVLAFAAFSCESALATVMTPVEVTGFNWDLVVEDGEGQAGSFDNCWGCSSDTNGAAFYGAGLYGAGLTAGLNASVSDPDATFVLQPFDGPNALAVLSSTWGTNPNGTLTLTTPAAYESLALYLSVGSAWGEMSYAVNYTDGTATPGTIWLGDYDWCGSSPYATMCDHRVSRDNGIWLSPDTSNGAKIYQVNLSGIDSSKTVSSIYCGDITNGWTAVGVFAVSGAQVPEPGSIILLAAAVAGLLVFSSRKRK